MITGDYDYLTNLAKFNVCSEHKTPLEVAWYGQERTWVLRCGQNHYPVAISRQPSLTQEYKQGTLADGPIKDNIERRERNKAMTENKQSQAMTMGGVPAVDLATGELLPLEVVKALVAYAKKYALDPARGHVVLMYSKPYITIDGYLYHANRYNRPYSLKSRPMTTDEEKQYKVDVTDHAWLAEVVFMDTGASFTGTGVVTYEEMIAKSTKQPERLRSPVVAAHPWQLAQKRAEWQALRRAFPIGETDQE